MAMRMAFQHLKELPQKFRFIADAFSAYPLAAQQFFRKFGEKFKFDITQVVGLTNDDAVSKEFRPFKQLIERLNRTYKASYRPTNGFDNYEGANYDLALWAAYYNFLLPHRIQSILSCSSPYSLRCLTTSWRSLSITITSAEVICSRTVSSQKAGEAE